MSLPTGSHPTPEAPQPRSPTPRKRKHRPWMPQKKARRQMKLFAERATKTLEEARAVATELAGKMPKVAQRVADGLSGEIAQEAVSLAAGLSSEAGVPGLSSGLDALLEILRKIHAMKTNVEGVDTLDIRVTTLKETLEKIRSQFQELPDDMRDRIVGLCKLWAELAQEAHGIKCRGVIKRFFTSNIDATNLQGLVQKVNDSIQDFSVKSLASIEANVHAIRHDVNTVRQDVVAVSQDMVVVRQDVDVVRQGVDVVRQDVGVVRQDVKAVRAQQDMSLLSNYARNARYNASSVRRECLEGTRKEVLADAYEWIHKSSEEVASCATEDKSGHFLWLSGLAGTGKTTIARTIARKYDDQGTLAADFFCSRFDAECRDPKRLFVTIARQLCQYHQPFQDKVVAILREKPDIVNANPLDQFKTLIERPLKELDGEFPTCVIIIDALDECQNEGIMSDILEILANHLQDLAPFLFIVTSRPEPHITAFFEKAGKASLKDSTKPVVLHNVHLKSVLDDIRRYLDDGFGEIRRAFGIEAGWPSNKDVNRLAELSKGLFIFAATVLRLIMETDCNNRARKKLLQDVLGAQNSLMRGLYNDVLRLSYKKVGTLHKTNPDLRLVLGVITVAEEPLSVPALANLLGMSESDVRSTLAGLRSVLHVPEEGFDEAARFIHPTFPEFLLDALVDKPEAFRITPAEHHLTLFTRSLEAMDSLTRNMAAIKTPTTFKSEVDELADIVKKCIPAHVAYACRFWSAHLLHCVSDALNQDAYDLLNRFLTTRMLYWLEACSLLRVLDGALAALETAQHTCENLGGSFGGLTALLADGHRFLWTYYYCIDTAPLEVYHSALAFAPTESLVRKAYTQELENSLIVRTGALSNWPPRRDAIRGHDSQGVHGVAFSPDGEYFATGGGDRKLKLWKTPARTMLQSFEGHTRDVNCVAFSPDGEHVASGSGGRDVRVWQASSGTCMRTLKGHTDSVCSVTYSAGGRRLLSATKEGEVKLWDTSDWRCIVTLDKTGKYTRQAGLSPDGGVIARGIGASLSLYNVASATDEALEFPEEVDACAFSPDGCYVAARSVHVIQVWQCADKSLVRTILLPDTFFGRLAFSRDGTRIGCGSTDGAVFLWQVTSEDPPFALRGHTSFVQDLSWSPDGLQVASASSDGTIRVCDASAASAAHVEEPAPSQPRPTPSGPPRFALARYQGVAVLLHLPSANVNSSDFVAAASMPEGAPTLTLFADAVDAWDAVLQVTGDMLRADRSRVWAAITGQQHVDFSTTPLSNQPVCISPNGSLLAYRSSTSDDVVDVCDLRAGKVAASLIGHTNTVSSIAFSPDSTLIATGSWDNSVKVWNATTGVVVHSHSHTDWVRSVVFSSDGHLVASGSDDKTVRVFRAALGRVERVFDGHRGWVMEVAFSADDKQVLALDYANWIYVWDMATGMRLFDISLNDNAWIHSLDFPSDDAATVPDQDRHEVRLVLPRMKRSLTWPLYVASTEGWVYAKSPGHTMRLRWLPLERRAIIAWEGSRFHCADSERRKVVTIDVSGEPEYVEAWGNGV